MKRLINQPDSDPATSGHPDDTCLRTDIDAVEHPDVDIAWNLLGSIDVAVFLVHEHEGPVSRGVQPGWLSIISTDNRTTGQYDELIRKLCSIPAADREYPHGTPTVNPLYWCCNLSGKEFSIYTRILRTSTYLLVQPLHAYPTESAEAEQPEEVDLRADTSIGIMRQTISRLERLAYHDGLTGLLNRSGFLASARKRLMIARSAGENLLLLMMDMDNLKPINDTLGHAAGDDALRATAFVLSNVFRGSDIVSRLGGDEFAVLAQCATPHECDSIMARFTAEINRHNLSDQAVLPLSVSIGSVWCHPDEKQTLTSYLAQADDKMYRSKRIKKLSVQA